MRRTQSPRTALERLIAALKEHAGWSVTIRKEEGRKNGMLVVKRPEKEAIEFTARGAADNLDILRVLACSPVKQGGAGWTREEYEARTRLELRDERLMRLRAPRRSKERA